MVFDLLSVSKLLIHDTCTALKKDVLHLITER